MSKYFNGEPLFYERPAFVKTAGAKLGDNPKEWESEILDVLHREHPYLVDSRVNIKMKKIDPESGSGIGSISLDDKISIPVVIESYRMKPLDVFFSGKEILPLTRERIEQALKTMSLGKPVSPAKGEATDSSLTNMTTAPYDGKYTFANSLSITESQFAHAINGAFTESGFVFDLANNELWKDALSSYLNNAQTQEKVAASKPKYSLTEVKPFNHDISKEAGIYNVPTSKGDKVGVLVPVTEKLASTSERWLFVSLTDGSYAPLDRPEVPYKPVEHLKIASHDIADGRGVFLNHSGGKLQATDIFEVLCKIGSDKVLLRDQYGRKFNLVKTAAVSRIEVGGGVVAVPETAVFLPTNNRVEITHTKVANRLEDGVNTITVSKRGSRMHFSSPNDWEFESVLSKEGSYPDEVIELLSPYFDDQSISQLVMIEEGKSKTFNVLTEQIEKIAKTLDLDVPTLTDQQLSAINHVAAMIDRDTIEIIKVAEGSARQTVDSLLGLNFLNKQNLHRFMDNMDKVGEARQVVGQLLMASRLGLDVDDAPLRTAFFALDDVEQDLQQLYNVTTAGR